jgi:hypothetical protein
MTMVPVVSSTRKAVEKDATARGSKIAPSGRSAGLSE